MRVGLIPLDERPANTRYPRMVASIAGVDLVLPPAEILSSFRVPAPTAELRAWLLREGPRLDALIVSLDMLCYGGLISSRTTHETTATVVSRLESLRELRRERPDMTMYGFGSVMRIPDADDATEEPAYWAGHGRALHRLSRLLDRHSRGGGSEEEITPLRRRIPNGVMNDFLIRRLRNHTVNLAALEFAAEGTLDFLILCSDDTSTWGLGSGEQGWLRAWVGRLGLESRVLQYPGADEVGCALVARLANASAGRAPRVEARFFPPEGSESVAPYENLPLAQTAQLHVRAVGAEPVKAGSAEGDLLLVLNAPRPAGGDWALSPPRPGGEGHRRTLEALVEEISQARLRGTPVAIADAAYVNGADQMLVDLLRERKLLADLAAYSGWNTAGNTIGTALAHGCAVLSAGSAVDGARERFLLHRFLEDWGYQTLVRTWVRRDLAESTGSPEPTNGSLARVTADVERQLSGLTPELPGLAGRFGISPGSTSLPWRRTFECDFELERLWRR